MEVEESEEEEGTSNPQTQKPEEILDIFKEQAGEDRIPFSAEREAMEQARDYNKLKTMKKERAKCKKEEEGESEEEEVEIEKLVHRDKRMKPKEDPKIAQMQEERMKELNEQTKHEFLLVSTSKDIIWEMMEKEKARKGLGKGNEKKVEDLVLLETARCLNILTKNAATIPDLPKEAPTPLADPRPQATPLTQVDPIPQAAPIPPVDPTPPP